MAPPFRPKHARPAGGRPGARRPDGPPPHRPGDIDEAVLYGVHPVVEALKNPQRRYRRLLATENGLRRLQEQIDPLPLEAEIVRPSEIDRLLTPDSVHQGLYLVCDPLPSPDLDSLPDDAIVLALDQITDPHNVGAIMRSAVAFNAGAVITTQRHSPTESGVLAKTASGALELIPYIQITNLSDALEELHKLGFQTVGLDSEGPAPLEGTLSGQRIALVMGSEGKGLRQKTRATCKALARLDMPGAIKSLNVSNAAAIALYASHRHLFG